MKLYSKKGDEGSTFCMKYLEMVPKNHPFVEFVGELDEAEASLGLASSLIPDELKEIKSEVDWIQTLLFRIGFTIAGKDCISEEDLKVLESIADKYSIYAKPLFLLNGGHPAATAVSLSRAIVRRVERRLIDLISRKEVINKEKLVLSILNRASSALYGIQLAINGKLGYETKRIECGSSKLV
ncbi:MAG: ATP:cob(I)alamin adenosyltransferase [Fervidicoccus fontis]|nr:MAG: ATP:cob(I)alamin adenosyltransferase [Fervidicoccus fontis]